jgi:hypothetical protein
MRIQAARLCVVDSNSTRTESCVNIRPDPAAPSRVDAPKAADDSGYRQIMRPSRGMRAGLKILVSPLRSAAAVRTPRHMSYQGMGSAAGEKPGRRSANEHKSAIFNEAKGVKSRRGFEPAKHVAAGGPTSRPST